MRRLGGTTMGGRGSATVAAIPLVAALALGGCGSDGDDGSGSDPSETETSSASTTETPTPTTSLPEPTPTTDPATGPRLDVEGVRVNAPARWRQTLSTVVVDTALGREGRLGGSLVLSVAGTGGDQLSLKQAERYFWNPGEKPPSFARQDTIVMGGATAGYYTARDTYDDFHAATLWDAGHVIKVELRLDRRMPKGRQQELFESVVASYESPRMR